MAQYSIHGTHNVPLKLWDSAGPFEAGAMQQLRNVASLPFIHRHVAGMPDVHWGKGATVGSVIATKAAIVPAAVGVDIGCGMMAVRTSLGADQLPDSLSAIRAEIERAVPKGFESTQGTNFLKGAKEARIRPYLSFKLDSRACDELPLPRPLFEVFVYSPRVEAIHLRGGRVARVRGG